MSQWTHPQCEACWIEDNTRTDGDGDPEVRRPTRIASAEITVETCCYCGKLTIFGIYRRNDPTALSFHTEHPE